MVEGSDLEYGSNSDKQGHFEERFWSLCLSCRPDAILGGIVQLSTRETD